MVVPRRSLKGGAGKGGNQNWKKTYGLSFAAAHRRKHTHTQSHTHTHSLTYTQVTRSHIHIYIYICVYVCVYVCSYCRIIITSPPPAFLSISRSVRHNPRLYTATIYRTYHTHREREIGSHLTMCSGLSFTLSLIVLLCSGCCLVASAALDTADMVNNIQRESKHHHQQQQPRPWMLDSTASPSARAALLIKAMNATEKIHMLGGNGTMFPYVGAVTGNKRLGIPDLFLNDGPQVR